MTHDPTMPANAPFDDTEPAFTEPWEAEAFALVVELARTGRLEWSRWVDALAAEIERSPNDPYYVQWVRAFEGLCVSSGLLDRDEIDERARQWHRAHLATPHGQPVTLDAGR
ncbi:MAG: nitrile hydratase accessory protein [Actinomycetota bacterium]|nr:nitrile hydratase accessory protein [Actinomycetota bacterium]